MAEESNEKFWQFLETVQELAIYKKTGRWYAYFSFQYLYLYAYMFIGGRREESRGGQTQVTPRDLDSTSYVLVF